MEVWQEALKIGLIGTERQAPTFPASEDPVSRLLKELNGEERERTLLSASGVLTAYRRAGYRPESSGEPLPLPAEAEERPPVPTVLMQDARVMVGGKYREALPEWLYAVAQHGWRLPEEHLVELLEFGRGHPEMREALLPLLGRRGRWLAEQNPEWKYALQVSLFEIENASEAETAGREEANLTWQTGTKEERVALLHRLRRFDPAKARALVESTWKQDPAAERAEFVATFTTGLSMEDEPFLENTLDDKRKEVRGIAQYLLALLPESRLCQRMWERVRPLVKLQTGETGLEKPAASGGLLNRVRSLLTPKAAPSETITVELPEVCDKAMIRDGIEAKPPYPRMGEKTWWLTQMLAQVPMTLWSREWGKTPAAIVAANRSEEWRMTLLQAWTEALRRKPDTEWAIALFRSWSETADKMPVRFSGKRPSPLDVFEAGLLHLLELSGPNIDYGNPAFGLLTLHKTEWSAPLAKAVLGKLTSFTGNPYYIGSLGAFAPYIPEAFRAQFSAVWSKLAEDKPYVQRQIDNYVALSTFCTEMRLRIDAAAALQEK